MSSSASVRFLQLLGWDGRELELFLPEWENTREFLKLSEEDIRYAADEFLPSCWDMSLLSVRKMIAAFIRETAELAKARQYKQEGKKILCSNSTSSFICLYANKLAGEGRLHLIYPDYTVSTVLQAFMGKPLPASLAGSPASASCEHCTLNCVRVEEALSGNVPEPTVTWNWGMHCDEAPKTEEMLDCLKDRSSCHTVLIRIPHDAPLGEVEAGNELRVRYLAQKIRRAQSRITAYTGIEVTDTHMRQAIGEYKAYMHRVERLMDLVLNADPQPISGNELALFSACMQVSFDSGMEAVNQALDLAIREIQERIEQGQGPLSRGAPKLACYFVPMNIPWVDRLFRDNGVNLSLGRAFPLASMMETVLNGEDPYIAAARQCLMCPDTVNVGDAARIVSALLVRYPLDGALVGFYDFDKWIGALQKTEMRLVEEKTGIPHFYLEGDFWSGNRYSMEDRLSLIRGICNCLKISNI